MTIFVRYLLILLVLSSCMTQKRGEQIISRIVDKYPSLAIDTVIKIPEIDVKVSVPLDTDYNYIDSIVINYVKDCDTSKKAVNKVIRDIKDSTINKTVLKDTTIYYEDITIHIWQEGNRIATNISKPETEIEDKDIYVRKKAWWENPFIWIILILVLLIILGWTWKRKIP